MLRWYVMHAKPCKERFLFEQLCLNQVETYLPLVKRIGKLSLQVGRPFFPGYLFVHTDVTECGISQLLWIPGAKGIVCFGGEPASVPDAFIQQLKDKMDLVNSGSQMKTLRFHEGDQVTISSGPFEGFQAVFNQYLPEHDRVRLLLKTLAENNYHLEVPAVQLAS